MPFRIDSDFADLHVIYVGDDRAFDVGVGLPAKGAVEARLADPAWTELSVH
mgnify:CR=1 FL=1